jgi:UDP-glucose 4-epimerase
MRALVTGGAGFIGSHLVDRLVDQSHEVLVVDDLSTGHADNLAPARARGGVKLHQLDIRDESLTKVAERYLPDVVFHLAAQAAVPVSVKQPRFDAEVNVVGTINVLEAARRSGTKRVVFASSGGAIYGSAAPLPVREDLPKAPDSPYGISKKIVEDYFRYYRASHDIDYVLLALANVYGPRQDAQGEAGVVALFASAMLQGRPPTIFGDGEQTRDFVYVEDVADAFSRAGDLGGSRLLNIGTGVETSVNRLTQAIIAATGFKGAPGYGPPRPGDVPRSVVDPRAAMDVIGWEPWTSLDDGIRGTVHWFRGAVAPL